MFVLTGVLHRLLCYTLLFLHLNVFLLPAGGIMIASTLLHILLRGVSNRFYVNTTNMDVFLTASCCCLAPTPTSPSIRAHNLLQAHSTITSCLLLAALAAAVFLSTDYGLPIISRPARLHYSSSTFYNLCLVATALLPVSISLYLIYKVSANKITDDINWFKSICYF